MSAGDDQLVEAWQRAGFKIVGGNRPYWAQKTRVTCTLTAMFGMAFAAIGYCVGIGNGITAEAACAVLWGIPGALFGYGFALAMVFSGRAIAKWKLSKLQQT